MPASPAEDLTVTWNDLTFTWNDLTLAGTLHIPEGEESAPVILMLQGSGPADRESDGYFTPIRQMFLKRGFATFAFDKPGCGESSGDWRDYGLEGRASQAAEALEFLAGHGSVDRNRRSVWGHSQGGWLAQMLASRHHDLSFAVASSGPSINVEDQNLYGCERTMRSQGHSEQEIEQALAFTRDVHAAAWDEVDYGDLKVRLLQPVENKPWYGSYGRIEDLQDWHLLTQLVTEGYEPLTALAQIQCPFLAVYGGLDVLVPPWRGAEESGRALQEAGNQDATIVVFPGGDHRLQDPATGDFTTGYLDLLGDWITRRAGARSG